MRKVCFRGRSVENNEWVYGSLVIGENDTFYIIQGGENIQVIGDTIGQLVGKPDKFGKEIFEGDKVYFDSEDEDATIVWDDDSCGFIALFEDETILLMGEVTSSDMELVEERHKE